MSSWDPLDIPSGTNEGTLLRRNVKTTEISCGVAEKISTPALLIGTAESWRSGSKKFTAVFFFGHNELQERGRRRRKTLSTPAHEKFVDVE